MPGLGIHLRLGRIRIMRFEAGKSRLTLTVGTSWALNNPYGGSSPRASSGDMTILAPFGYDDFAKYYSLQFLKILLSGEPQARPFLLIGRRRVRAVRQQKFGLYVNEFRYPVGHICANCARFVVGTSEREICTCWISVVFRVLG